MNDLHSDRPLVLKPNKVKAVGRVLLLRTAVLLTVSLLESSCIESTHHGQTENNGNLYLNRKKVIGAVETFEIGDTALKFNARIDTGAKTSSIHAEDIRVEAGDDSEGNPITFTIRNEFGESSRITSIVHSVVKIRTAEGSGHRYKVPLTVNSKDVKRKVMFTLNDRKKMNYKMLIGRNWLACQYVVDVEINNKD